MTDPTPEAHADGASFRTPPADDLDGCSPMTRAFFMSPEAAVRTYGLPLVAALIEDGFDGKAMLELLAVHMAVPTSLPVVDGIGEPARIEVKGHESLVGLVRVVGRRKADADTLTPGGVILEYFDLDAGRPVVRWLSEFVLFSIGPICEGELLDRLFDRAVDGGWRRHSPEPILLRWQTKEDGAEFDEGDLLDRAAIEFAAALKACPLPGAWGKGLAPAVILLHLRRLLEDRGISRRPATATDLERRAVRAPIMPRWLPQALVDAALAWHDAESGRDGDGHEDDPVRF